MWSPEEETYFGNSDDHVVDGGFESGYGASVLVFSVPHLDSNVKTFLFLSAHLHHSHVDGHMAQVSNDGTSWSDNGDLSSLNCNLN